MLGMRTADPEPPEQVRFVRADMLAGGVMEHLADLDAATEQLVTGGGDVGDDQVQALSGARRRRGDVLAEDDRASARSTSDTGMTTISNFMSTLATPASLVAS